MAFASDEVALIPLDDEEGEMEENHYKKFPCLRLTMSEHAQWHMRQYCSEIKYYINSNNPLITSTSEADLHDHVFRHWTPLRQKKQHTGPFILYNLGQHGSTPFVKKHTKIPELISLRCMNVFATPFLRGLYEVEGRLEKEKNIWLTKISNMDAIFEQRESERGRSSEL